MSPFLKQHNGGFDPETLAILDMSFDATFKELRHNPYFDQVSARTLLGVSLIPKRSRHWHWQPSGLIVTDRAKGEPRSRLHSISIKDSARFHTLRRICHPSAELWSELF
jgi:hypothetical protein